MIRHGELLRLPLRQLMACLTNPLASASPGINGLKPFTLTFTDRLLSDKETCPKGYAASNEACCKDGSKFRTDWKGDYIPTGAKNNKNKYVESNNIKGIYKLSCSGNSM